MKRPHFSFSHLWGGLKSLHTLSHPPQPPSGFPPSSTLLLHPRQEHLSAAGRGRRGGRGGRTASGLPLCTSIYLWLSVTGLLGEGEMEDTNRCWKGVWDRKVRLAQFPGGGWHLAQHTDTIKYEQKQTVSLCWWNERGAACVLCFPLLTVQLCAVSRCFLAHCVTFVTDSLLLFTVCCFSSHQKVLS